MNLLKEVLGIMRAQREHDAGQAEQHQATVLRRDESGTLWVHIPGGADETPVNGASYATARPGDVVKVTIGGGVVDVEGNSTSPSVGGPDVTEAIEPVRTKVAQVSAATGRAYKAAREAAEAAMLTDQHFWHRSDNADGAGAGAFVTDMTQEDFLTGAETDFADASDSKPYNNMLITSVGMLLRSAKNVLVSHTRSTTAFFDGLGNAASNVIASFGADGATIGREQGLHMLVENVGVTIKNGINDVMALRTYADGDGVRDYGGLIRFGSRTVVTGVDDLDDDGFAMVGMTAGNSGVADERAGAVYASMSAQTQSKYCELRVTPDGARVHGPLSASGDVISNGMALTRTRVKGDKESSYHTGDVNLTAAKVGAAAEGHGHGAGDIDSGTLALARGGTASDNTRRLANTVFAGPSGEAGYASWRSLVSEDLPIVPVAKGGTGADNAHMARANLGAASAQWTQIASTTGTTAAAIDLSERNEVCIVARHGTSYLGSVVLPKAALHASTLREVYLGGWGNNGTSSNRRAVAKVSRASIEPVSIRVDNVDYTDSTAVWTVFAR